MSKAKMETKPEPPETDTKPVAITEPLPKAAGRHGPQTKPVGTDSMSRLYRLLGLSADTPLMGVLREAGDEIVRLRQIRE